MLLLQKLAVVCVTAFALLGCSAAERYTVSSPQVTKKLPSRFKSIELRDVSLPNYAAADEIHVRDATGKLISSDKILWADNPERAVALELSRNLAKLTSARVASEPWPFESFPEARLDVRFENMIARSDGFFQVTGQYFVGSQNERGERAGLFDLAVPLGSGPIPQAIAQARGEAILRLAEYLVLNGLR